MRGVAAMTPADRADVATRSAARRSHSRCADHPGSRGAAAARGRRASASRCRPSCCTCRPASTSRTSATPPRTRWSLPTTRSAFDCATDCATRSRRTGRVPSSRARVAARASTPRRPSLAAAGLQREHREHAVVDLDVELRLVVHDLGPLVGFVERHHPHARSERASAERFDLARFVERC